MKKLRLCVIVGICGVLFGGCTFFEGIFGAKDSQTNGQDSGKSSIFAKSSSDYTGCTPKDLKERLKSYGRQQGKGRVYEQTYEYDYDNYFKWNYERWKAWNDGNNCNKKMLDSYNKAIKNAKKLPTTIDEEKAFKKEWVYCDKKPEWLEKTLDKYIEQNKNNDLKYIEASEFKVKEWDSKFDRKTYANSTLLGEESTIMVVSGCVASEKAIQAIQNDLIPLGNGKKAKCADLSYKDAQKCVDYFENVYNKTYKAIEKDLKIKATRQYYEQKNKK